MHKTIRSSERLFAPILFHPLDRMEIELGDYGTTFVVDIYQESQWDDRRVYPSFHAQRTFPARIAERKHLDGLCRWEFAATDWTVSLIHELWPPEQVSMSADAKVAFEYILATILSQDEAALTSAAYHNKMNPQLDDLEDNDELPLADYQKVALHNAMRSEGYGLFMEQGTGKTPVVIARVCNDANKGHGPERMYRAIIICPNSVRLNWKNEFDRFATVPGQVTILRGGEVNRAKQLIDAFTPGSDPRYTVVICGYETLSRTWKALGMIDWDLAVLDESHYTKNPSTKRAKHAMMLRDRSAARMVLTGTPVTNHMLDLYSQLEFLGKGWSGFQSWKRFREFYGVWKTTGAGYEKLVGATNTPFMKERLARMAFLIRKEEAMPDLPSKVYDVHEVEMTTTQAEYYKTIRDHLILELENELETSKNKSLTINNILTKLLRLAQITSGFLTWDKELGLDGEVISDRRIEYLADNPKIGALLDILRDKSSKSKTLIWACWTPDVLAIHAALNEHGIRCVRYFGGCSEQEREDAVAAFNGNTDVRACVGNAAAGGIGLNLIGYPPHDESVDTNCDHVIYFSQNWSPTARSQSEDRPHRKGTRVNVRVTDLCVPGTIDEEIRARVLQKRMNAYEISDVRQILVNVLRGKINEG
jgi:SNF2 family DNA or RNA helicase